MLTTVQSQAALVDNLVRLNLTWLTFGDHFLSENKPQDALKYFRQVINGAETTKRQNERIASLQKRIAAVEASARNPAYAAAAAREKAGLSSALTAATAALEAFAKIPDFDEALWFRIGRAYLDAGRPWEGMLVLRHTLEKSPKSELREPIMATMTFALPQIVSAAETQEWCKTYLSAFPKGGNADAIGYLAGAVAMQKGEYASAETELTTMLEQQPQNARRGEMLSMLTNALSLQGKFPQARERYDAYLKDFPEGEFVQDIFFQRSLTFLYEGNYEQAVAGFNHFLEKYPESLYAPEAKYRLAVTDYAAKDYEKVITETQDWFKKYPGDVMQAENFSLLGDAFGALNRTKEAADAYGQAVESAKTDEVTQYALTEAQKMYQKAGEWDKVAEMFGNFLQAHPDSPLAVTALYWVGRAKERLGQPEEAVAFTVENIRKYINDQRRDAVEQLLLLYAQLAAKKSRSVPNTIPAANPQDTTEIEKTIAAALSAPNDTPLAKARILYTQAEAARVRRNQTQAAVLRKKIATEFQPEELSAPLLALAGDTLIAASQPEKARKFYEMLRDDFPKSSCADSASVGLGGLALVAGDNAEAEKLFRAAVAKSGPKLPDALIGLSRTLLAQQKYAEAEKLLQQVAGTKEWRGEATPSALYYLGECEYGQGKYAEANAFFQRVFVSWGKYPAWVARSYLRSADSLFKLGRKPDGVRTLQEMVKQENLGAFPETEKARQQLQTAGG